jgi:AbiV family abortive infection protein
MDLRAVKDAHRSQLVACAVAAASNAQDLVADAELLVDGYRWGRACSLAVLAIEEVGKSVSLVALSLLPDKVKSQAPIGRLLEWHELKLAGGLLLGLLPPSKPGVWLASMERRQLVQMMRDSELAARRQDLLKLTGLYVDMDRNGRVQRPCEVTQANAVEQLGHARQAANSAKVAILDPRAPVHQANPPKYAVVFAKGLIAALADAGSGRKAEDAADIILQAASTLQDC